MKVFRVLLVLVWVFPLKVFTQDMAGLVTDRYGGVNRLFINPASVFGSPTCVDILLITANIGAHNNYAYIDRNDFTFSDLINRNSNLYTNPTYFTRDNLDRIQARQYGRLHGPSVRFNYKDHSFAIITGARTLSNFSNLPVNIVNFIRKGLYYPQQHDILFVEDNLKIASLGWAEAGISYATVLQQDSRSRLTAGVTARFLWGFHSVNARSERLTYRVNNDLVLDVDEFVGEGDFSLPLNYNGLAYEGFGFNGKGLGFDFGIFYTRARGAGWQKRMWNSFETNVPYAWTLGFSLLDIGAVNFNENTRRIAFENTNVIWPALSLEAYDDVDVFLDDLGNRVESGRFEALRDDNFYTFLPAAASVQMDYNFGRNFYGYFLWVQDIPFTSNRVSRPSHIGIIPRYERRWFALAVPLTLYEYTRPRVGVSVRLGFLTIGAEQPAGLLKLTDLEGFDVYFSLQWGIRCNTTSKYNICPDNWR